MPQGRTTPSVRPHRFANDLPAVIYIVGLAPQAAERAELDHDPPFRRCGRGTTATDDDDADEASPHGDTTHGEMLGAGAAEAKQLARPGHGAAAGAEPWSPNGRKIAFHGGNDTSNIYVMNADGSAVRRVAFGWNPAWQPYD